MRQLQTEVIKNIVVYQPGKPVEEVERELGISGIVKLASNENPLGPSPFAAKAMKDYLDETSRYPDGGGFYLRKELSDRLGFPIEQIILGNGSCEIIEMAAKAFIMPGEKTVMSKHVFIMGYIATKAVNGDVEMVPMDRNLVHDLDAMADAVDDSTKIVYIANPNNPTGTCVTKSQMEVFLKKIPEDVVVVIDEAYKEYIDRPDYPDGTDYLDGDRRLLVLRTFSKAYGMAGVRIGYGIGSKEVVDGLNRIRSPFNTSSIAQVGAMAALDDEDHLERSRRMNSEEMRYLYGELEKMGVEYVPSVTNFILVHCGMDCMDAFQKLLEKGVIVRPMKGYGFPESFRLSIGTRDENVKFVAAFRGIMEG